MLVSRTPLHTAAFQGNLMAVEWLCQQKNVSINAQESSETDGLTALHKAVTQGHTVIVDCLLNNNANPRVPLITGETPLATALIQLNSYIPDNKQHLRSQYQAIVTLFLDKGIGLSRDDLNYLYEFAKNKGDLLSVIETSLKHSITEKKKQCQNIPMLGIGAQLANSLSFSNLMQSGEDALNNVPKAVEKNDEMSGEFIVVDSDESNETVQTLFL